MRQRAITESRKVRIWSEASDAFEAFVDASARQDQLLGSSGQRLKHGFGGNDAEEYRKFVATGCAGLHTWIACINPPGVKLIMATEISGVGLWALGI